MQLSSVTGIEDFVDLRTQAIGAADAGDGETARELLEQIQVPDTETAGDLFAEALTTGPEAFDEGERWLREGETEQARRRFGELSEHYGTTWIGRAARERLVAMGIEGDGA